MYLLEDNNDGIDENKQWWERGRTDTDVMERMVNFSGNQKLNQIKVKPNRNELKHEK